MSPTIAATIRRTFSAQMFSCPVAGEDAGGHEQRIARQEEADHEPGLGEDDRGHRGQASDADQRLDVGQLVEEILEPLHRRQSPGNRASTTDEMPPREEKRPVTVMLFGRQAAAQSRRIRLTAFS